MRRASSASARPRICTRAWPEGRPLPRQRRLTALGSSLMRSTTSCWPKKLKTSCSLALKGRPRRRTAGGGPPCPYPCAAGAGGLAQPPGPPRFICRPGIFSASAARTASMGSTPWRPATPAAAASAEDAETARAGGAGAALPPDARLGPLPPTKGHGSAAPKGSGAPARSQAGWPRLTSGGWSGRPSMSWPHTAGGAPALPPLQKFMGTPGGPGQYVGGGIAHADQLLYPGMLLPKGPSVAPAAPSRRARLGSTPRCPAQCAPKGCGVPQSLGVRISLGVPWLPPVAGVPRMTGYGDMASTLGLIGTSSLHLALGMPPLST
mmetsp:Transcript_35889/g.92379  ORF Transcript_35889/g.92379 Transcript_35889/m.92379 type:complete len:321 (+) Transcript_35889:931-1893(+)